MAGNPRESKWRATPRAARNRKPLSVTLSEEARARLEAMAEVAGMTLSGVVEVLALHPKAHAVVEAFVDAPLRAPRAELRAVVEAKKKARHA